MVRIMAGSRWARRFSIACRGMIEAVADVQTFHTFSFASWQDDEYDNFGPLRVINEDRVEVRFLIHRYCLINF